MTRVYTKWTLVKRRFLENFLSKELSSREIAKKFGVAHTTITRELKRCPRGKYVATEAHKNAAIGKEASARSNSYQRQIEELRARIEALEKGLSLAPSKGD